MRFLPAVLLTLVLCPLVAAQSFDCKLAKSPREHAICSNRQLSELDINIAAAYQAARSKLSPAAFALVQSDQREWLRWLDNVCPHTDSFLADCLIEHYRDRRQQLTDGIVTVNGITFYPRAQYGFAPDTRKPEDRDLPGPDFNSDEDVYPQIDKPTPAQAAWNATFHPDAPLKPPTDDNVTERDSNTYDVIAANDRLINIAFNGIFDTGGAHPQIGESNDVWWLDKHRKLIASDVFRPGSGWQQKLIDPGIRKLGVNADDDLDSGHELRQGVSDGIARVSSWSVTSIGLTVTFAQYEVGGHAGGLPDITFTWDELKPYLSPTLNPSTLPAPIKSGPR